MDKFIATTWDDFYNYLNSLLGNDNDIEIELNMTESEATQSYGYINFPEKVRSCILSSVNEYSYYLSISTSRTSYFELTIKNMKISNSGHVINIAKPQYSVDSYPEDYNKLILSGSNSFTSGSSCEIHVGEGTGLYIELEESSYTGIGTSGSSGWRNVSAKIGGSRGESCGNVFVSGEGGLYLASHMGAGIGGGGGDQENPTVGNCGDIEISGSVYIHMYNTGYSVGIGGGATLYTIGESKSIKIYDRASIFVSNSPRVNLGGGSQCDVEIYGNTNLDILGGIAGRNLTIKNTKLIINELIYKNYAYTGSLTFDDGYIVVNKANHEQYPQNRGDYFVFSLTDENKNPYTLPVTLEKINNTEDSIKNLSGSRTANTIITPDNKGYIRMYISSGNYYFVSYNNPNIITETFSVNTNLTHEDPFFMLGMKFGGGTFSGNVKYHKDDKVYGEENVVVSLYDTNKVRTKYSGMTNEDGNYVIEVFEAGDYYVGFSNVPHETFFVSGDSSLVTETGISKTSYNLSEENPGIVVNAEIMYNKGILGIPGASGKDGISFPSSSINLFKFESQIVYKYDSVDLGQVVEGNGSDIYYSAKNNSIVLAEKGTYIVKFQTNASFINDYSDEDYLALQLKLGDEYIKHGFSYLRNSGLLYKDILVRCYRGGCQLQLINVGSQNMSIDNFNITILKAY